MNKNLSKKSITRKTVNFQISDIATYLVAIEFVLVFVSIFRFLYLQVPVNEYLSWPLIDAGGEETEMFRIGGIHAFSDFMQPFIWSKLENPWILGSNHLAQYPPLAVFAIKPLSVFPYQISGILYLLLMSISSVIAIFYVTKNLKYRDRILLSIPFGIGSVPFFMAFDRGNIIGFFGLIFSIFIVAVFKSAKKVAVFALVLLIAIKIYPVVLMLVFLKLRWFREAATVLIASLAISLFLFVITPGDFTATISGWLNANLAAFNQQGQRASGVISAALVELKILGISQAIPLGHQILSLWNLLRWGLFSLILIYFVFFKEHNRTIIVLFSTIASTIIYSAQLGYNWYWIPIFAAFVLAELGKSEPLQFSKLNSINKYLLFVVVGFTVVSLPIGLNIPGSSTPITAWLATALSMILVISYLFMRFSRKMLRK